jgi:hypothetical protein
MPQSKQFVGNRCRNVAYSKGCCQANQCTPLVSRNFCFGHSGEVQLLRNTDWLNLLSTKPQCESRDFVYLANSRQADRECMLMAHDGHAVAGKDVLPAVYSRDEFLDKYV